MRFYTYYYLLSRIEVTNWLQIFFIVLATSILLFGVFKYYKEKKQSKYRELSLIALFLVLIMIGIRINDIQIHKAIDDGYGTALKLIEELSETMNIPKEDIVINTQAARDGAIIRVAEEKYYRVIYADGKMLLEKLELYHPQIEIIDAESNS